MRLRARLPKDTEWWGLGSEVGGLSAHRPRPGYGEACLIEEASVFSVSDPERFGVIVLQEWF